MTSLLQREHNDWQRQGGLHTAEEIAHQPAIWRALATALEEQRSRIDAFLGDWLRQPGHRVILTGAGSSAYIGEMAADTLNAAWPAEVRAVASTSLLTHPELYLKRAQPTLLVSFARSGNSPESLATVELLRASVAQPRFLNITCNAEGELLSGSTGRADTLNLLMPEGSCDRGFAMTSSLTTMLLAALATLGAGSWPERLARIRSLADLADAALRDWAAPMQALARREVQRIVYLGSGAQEALAREAALKVLELTSGRVMAVANTPLGFRHGPKSMLDEHSLVLVLRSRGPVARRYECDLVQELRSDGIAAAVLTLGPEDAAEQLPACLPIPPLPQDEGLDDAWLTPLWLIAPQLLALNKSLALGLTPDNPFPDGRVNRVVQGVTIHSHDG
ncbi:SIS domain-containing protein [Roseateles saccharophilus]|uniref:Tagatose-6-phosphate ketose/aldose isomerase n=1 Tax=Roseateles saccharophilus TaxID=304 RepID=A0A4R3UG79_ROSSA|nr:SIS domain-containing protein [Roseateles saccharophilus]MDG0835239.1 SIS domain-containing protein [Roseateles saccharophilus]TCU86869.1 tagatose-6-phosphate ketose/aldose isomerase [Roseateles saccharophilus]